jgi:F-box and leucine-rich repeat protein 10/11
MADVSVPSKQERCKFCKDVPEHSARDEDAEQWIKCDACKQWIHYLCVNLTETEAASLSTYHCPDCAGEYGPSQGIRMSKRKRTAIDYVALDSGDTMASTMIHPYCGLFKTRKFDTEHVKEMKGSDLTAKWAEATGMLEPVIIRKQFMADLDLGIPSDLDVHKVCELVGEDSLLEVIDVVSQGLSPGWTMGKWRDYYYSQPSKRSRIHNVISLEFSNTKLSKVIQRPRFVRNMDLVDKVWPAILSEKGDFPKVKLYCLMSVQDSYTDFHIDFGGSSVFYHVCRGIKTFLFIPPTKTNLAKYAKWCNSSDQSSQFFADLCSDSYRVDLQQNDTLIIPSGWIHAVYTPVDSLVIGGNFLTPINMPMQIELTNIEKKTKVPKKFRFPHFMRVLWFTAHYYFDKLPARENLSAFEIEGLRPMLNVLLEESEKLQADEKLAKESLKGLPSQVKLNPKAFVENFGRYVYYVLGQSEQSNGVNLQNQEKAVKEESSTGVNSPRHPMGESRDLLSDASLSRTSLTGA